MLNKVQIIGNLGQDPDMRVLNSGTAVTNLSIATTERWKDKQSGEKQERTEWHRVSMFGRLAEIAADFLRKGSKVYIEGKLQTRKWQDNEGKDRYSTDIQAHQLVMLDSKRDGDAPAPRQQQPQRAGGVADAKPQEDDFDDDIPF